MALYFKARSIERAVFPEAVGPRIAIVFSLKPLLFWAIITLLKGFVVKSIHFNTKG